MKIGMKNKQEMIEKALAVLNDGTHPFEAAAEGDSIIVNWRWKDAVIFGAGSAAKEISEFRYVVVLNDDGTFWGYDTDMENSAGVNLKGHVGLSSSAFVGHEVRIHKEMAVGKNAWDDTIGLKSWSFSTKEIHEPVRAVFEMNGWIYKEPSVSWVKLTGAGARTWLMLGLLFLVIGLMFTALFINIGVIPGALITGIVCLVGLWAVLVGTGKKKLPVLSTKMTVILTFGVIFGSWILIAIGIGIVVLLGVVQV